MIDFSRAELTHFILHGVGNKGLGEALNFKDQPILFKDDFTKETVLKYLLSSFKTDMYYQFKGKIDLTLNSVANCAEDLFNSQVMFTKISQNIAKILYDQTIHPKIKGGAFYVCFFKDVVVDGELVNCVGLFKTERYETYIKLNESSFDIDTDHGIDVSKLDKGCLIFNTDKMDGYKISIVNNGKSNHETALYWTEDFLNAKLKANAYYHTKNQIDICRAFVEEKLNHINELDRLAILNRSVNYFTEIAHYHQNEFNKEVLKDDALIEDFTEYQKDYQDRLNIPKAPEEFDVSATAVKQNKKHMRQVIKLDKNFHLYVHANTQHIEKGYDEKKGMKFYKVYFVNEE
jgi:hypothetical protein